MTKRLIVNTLIIVIATLGIIFLWELDFALSATLFVLAFIKHKYVPIKRESAWFFSMLIGTFILENFVLALTNAWVYSNADLLYTPIFMPIFWALLGTTLLVYYKELFEK